MWSGKLHRTLYARRAAPLERRTARANGERERSDAAHDVRADTELHAALLRSARWQLPRALLSGREARAHRQRCRPRLPHSALH